MRAFRFFIKYIIGYIYWNFHNIVRETDVKCYTVSTKSTIGKRVMIRNKNHIYGDVKIGDYSYISGPSTLVQNATIGKFCSIARNVSIGPGNHDLGSISTHPFLYSTTYGFIKHKKELSKNDPPVIGNDVWIGLNSIVLNNVTIGDGAIIGAGSVVTKHVAPYSIVGGVPAKHLKYRFDNDVITQLLQIKWWDWSDDKIRQNLSDFHDIEHFITKHQPK